MKKQVDWKQLKTRDRTGGTIITDLFKFEDNTYTAYSFYWQDEECVAEACGLNPEKVVKESRKNLRKEWKKFQEWKNENSDHISPFENLDPYGKAISFQDLK